MVCDTEMLRSLSVALKNQREISSVSTTMSISPVVVVVIVVAVVAAAAAAVVIVEFLVLSSQTVFFRNIGYMFWVQPGSTKAIVSLIRTNRK